MSIATAIQNAQAKIAAAYTACDEKGATMPGAADQNLSHLAATIATITGGSPAPTPDPEAIPDVIFIDYDGTITNTYTRTEFASLSALPSNPTHTGLTSQGWNWTLSDAKAYVASYGRLVIGQMYVTSDGKTYLGVKIDDTTYNTVSFKISNSGNKGEVVIDWGDGTTETTIPNTYTHTYASNGEYTISFSTANNVVFDWFGPVTNNATKLAGKALKWARLGSTITELTNAFRGCYSLEYATVPHGITRFRDYSFQWCASLKAFVTPDTVTALGSNMWDSCYSMEYISLGKTAPVSTSYFLYCFSLRTINIPPVVTALGNTTFDRCINLRAVTLPEGLLTIGQQAFRDCFKLEEINIPSTLTSVGRNAFEMCHRLKELSLPSGTTVSTSLCAWCSGLETASISKNIDNSDFYNCFSLKSITIGSGVITIGTEAFNRCVELKSITLPEGLTTIGNTAFSTCSKLEEVEFPSTLTSIGTNVFQNCRSLKSVTFDSQSSYTLGQYAFNGCSTLESIDLSGATTIAQYAFSDCYNLESVVLSASMTAIPNYMFTGCCQLPTLSIPASVTSIGQYAFSAMNNLRHLYVYASTPPSAGSNFLANTPTDITIHVPSGTLSAYQSATNWSAFASKMVEM